MQSLKADIRTKPWPEIVLIVLWRAGLTLQFVVLGLLVTQSSMVTPLFAQIAPVTLGCAVVSILLEVGAGLVGTQQLYNRTTQIAKGNEALRQTDELFVMAEMLQSADSCEDATAVLMASSLRLLPHMGGTLYIFNNSRDRLDLTVNWQLPIGHTPAETLSPTNCWALKRGKRHVNDPGSGSLCCAHHTGGVGTLEIPMMARGKIYGLLMFVTDAPDSFRDLFDSRRLGQALSDSMSLALSNIALREALRTETLRDPLTGLYNRRYMIDALERYANLAERTRGSTAVLMIDLDNFKRLNDEHGHCKGDVVLRDVAGQLIGGLRPADIVCRYGGEELLVIMPECPLDDAVLRANVLRARIEGLSDTHGFKISASLGVAAIPETSSSVADLVPMADAALYRAKLGGKNCVVAADRRTLRDDPPLRLAVADRANARPG